MPLLLMGDINVTKSTTDSIVDIRNYSDNIVIVHVDSESVKLDVNQAVLFRCYTDKNKYISIEQKINEDFYVDCGSKVVITNELL